MGPKVGDELRQKGAWSVIAATVMMGIYIWLRFELRFGLGAVIALIHDVLVTIGALILANYEFDLTIVAALLTIVGFSVNDTVIVCDRVRENMRKIKREAWKPLSTRASTRPSAGLLLPPAPPFSCSWRFFFSAAE